MGATWGACVTAAPAEGTPAACDATSKTLTPADAATLGASAAVQQLAGWEQGPELVISGTNRGGNDGLNVNISGTLGAASVDGEVAGNVLSKPDSKGLLVLSEKGRIEGGVRVHDAVINGTILGDVEVDHFLELQANAKITGNIRYRNLQMECGARVEGRLDCVAEKTDERAAQAPNNVVALPKAAEG